MSSKINNANFNNATVSGTLTVGKGSNATDAAAFGQALEQWRMNQKGFVAWNFDPAMAASAGNVCVTQSLYVMKVPLPYQTSITGAVVAVTTAGSSLVNGQNLVTLYSQSGTKRGDSPDQTAIWTTASTYAAAFSGGPYLESAGYVWVSILSNGTTPASFAQGSTRNASNAVSTGIASGAALWASRGGTAVTSTATITPSALVVTSSFNFWIGLY